MKTKRIMLITCAIFSIVILLSQNNIEKVYAVTFTKVINTSEDIAEVFADFNTSTLWVLTNDATNADTFVYGCDITTNSNCVRYNITITTDTDVTGQDIWCGRTNCYISYGCSTSSACEFANSGHLLRIATTSGGGGKGVIINPILNRTTGGLYEIDGKDSLTGGFGGVNIWADACNVDNGNGSCRHTLILFDGITMGSSMVFTEWFGGNGGFVATDVEWNNVAGANGLIALAITNIYGAQDFSGYVVYSTATFGIYCNKVSPSGLTPVVGTSFIEWKQSTNEAGFFDEFYMGSGLASTTHLFNVNATACSGSPPTISNAITGLSTVVPIREGIILQDQDIMLLQESGANARV